MLIYIYLLLIFGVSAFIININTSKRFIGPNCSQLNETYEKKFNKFIVIYSALILIFVASFRAFSVGTDTNNYFNHYNDLLADNKAYGLFEPFFELINFIVVKSRLSFSYVLFISSTIIISAFSFIIYKYSKNVSFSFFLLVALGIYGNSFNALRQYLALAIFLYSIRYIIDGQFIPYLACCIIAYLFHNSAIILLPLFLIRYIKMNKKFIIISVILLIVLGFCLGPVVKLISMFTKIDYYNRYLTNPEFIEPIKLYYVLYSIGMLAVFFIFYYFKRYIDKLSSEQKSIYNFFLIIFYISVCIRFYGTFSGLFSLVNRFSIYFFFPIILLIPYVLPFIKEKLKNICIVAILCLGIVYNIISAVVRGSNGVYPYNFVFDNLFLLIGTSIFLIICCVMIILTSLKIDIYKVFEKNKKKSIDN